MRLFFKSPAGNYHFFGSRLVVGKVGGRKQILITYRMNPTHKNWSFGWGKM